MYLVFSHLRSLFQPDSSGLRAVGEQIAHGMLDKSSDTEYRAQMGLLV